MNLYDNIEVLRLQTPEELAHHREGELDAAWFSLGQAVKAMGVLVEPTAAERSDLPVRTQLSPTEQTVVAEAEQIVQELSVVLEAEQITKQAAQNIDQALQNTYDVFSDNPLLKGTNQ